MFFFFKQKTAYEMRISDWSSDVCSSDLMADVLQSTAQPEISIDRWLAASMIGERCEDADALKFARDHQKSLSGGTSGILLPEFFQGQWIDGLRANIDRKSTRLNSSH